SSTTEAFRALRTSLDFLVVGQRNRVLTVTSSSVQEGKSITAANLSIVLAEAGMRVVLVDCDLRRPRVAEYLGLEGGAGLSDVLVGRAELDDVLQYWGKNGLHALPSGRIPPNPSELLGSEAMDLVLETLSADFDFVILDAPPALAVTDSAVIGKKATGTLVVAAAQSSRKPAVLEAISMHEDIGAHVSGIIVTKLPPNGEDLYVYGSRDSYGTPPTAGEQPERPAHTFAADRDSELSGLGQTEHDVHDDATVEIDTSSADRPTSSSLSLVHASRAEAKSASREVSWSVRSARDPHGVPRQHLPAALGRDDAQAAIRRRLGDPGRLGGHSARARAADDQTDSRDRLLPGDPRCPWPPGQEGHRRPAARGRPRPGHDP